MNLSIHFPLTREDNVAHITSLCVFPFNPLPSHEGRPEDGKLRSQPGLFQSTSLSRGKTLQFRNGVGLSVLSIHFPLTREDEVVSVASRLTDLSIHFPLTREDTR